MMNQFHVVFTPLPFQLAVPRTQTRTHDACVANTASTTWRQEVREPNMKSQIWEDARTWYMKWTRPFGVQEDTSVPLMTLARRCALSRRHSIDSKMEARDHGPLLAVVVMCTYSRPCSAVQYTVYVGAVCSAVCSSAKCLGAAQFNSVAIRVRS